MTFSERILAELGTPNAEFAIEFPVVGPVRFKALRSYREWREHLAARAGFVEQFLKAPVGARPALWAEVEADEATLTMAFSLSSTAVEPTFEVLDACVLATRYGGLMGALFDQWSSAQVLGQALREKEALDEAGKGSGATSGIETS